MELKTKLLCALLLCALAHSHAAAQIFTQVIDEQELQFKVKQIDEFFRRFNYETDYKGDSTDSTSSDSILKRKNLMTLFNLEKFADKSGKKLDSIASAFLDYICDNNIRINYTDTTWRAEATSSLTFNGKSYPLEISLRTEQVKGVIYKWVICDVASPLFSALQDSINKAVSISPNAHGTSFMTVPDAVNLNSESVRAMFHKGYKPCSLCVFEWLIASGRTRIGHVTKVTYRFRLHEYSFTVERFENRKSYNKGWLISDIIKNH